MNTFHGLAWKKENKKTEGILSRMLPLLLIPFIRPCAQPFLLFEQSRFFHRPSNRMWITWWRVKKKTMLFITRSAIPPMTMMKNIKNCLKPNGRNSVFGSMILLCNSICDNKTDNTRTKLLIQSHVTCEARIFIEYECELDVLWDTFEQEPRKEIRVNVYDNIVWWVIMSNDFIHFSKPHSWTDKCRLLQQEERTNSLAEITCRNFKFQVYTYILFFWINDSSRDESKPVRMSSASNSQSWIIFFFFSGYRAHRKCSHARTQFINAHIIWATTTRFSCIRPPMLDILFIYIFHISHKKRKNRIEPPLENSSVCNEWLHFVRTPKQKTLSMKRETLNASASQ